MHELTRNQQTVLEALREHGSCQTAYELLETLRGSGIATATSVYRALYALAAQGLVHRVESRNAFIACQHEKHRAAPALTICRACDRVEELEPPDLKRVIVRWCRVDDFLPDKITLEIVGLCGRCQDGTPPARAAHA